MEDILTIVKRFYVKDGKVYARNIDQEIVDEQAILPIKAAYLIFNESEIRYKSDLGLLGKKYVSDRNKYLEKMMERFSVNGEENDLGQNKLIRDLVASNGHYEENISSDGLDAKFSIFIEPKKEYGLAYFRLKLRETGYDTDDIYLSYDTANLKDSGMARLFIDFKKKTYVEKDEEAFDDNSMEYKFAYGELDKAIKNDKVDRIDYWSNFLKQWKKAKIVGDSERIQYLKDIVATVLNDIEMRKNKHREEVAEANKREEQKKVQEISEKLMESTVKTRELPKKAEPSEDKKSEEYGVQDVEKIIEKIALARKNGDEEACKHWNGVLNSINIVEESLEKPKNVIEPTKPKLMNSLLRRFDEVLREIEQNKKCAKDRATLMAVYNETRNAMKICGIDVFSPTWKEFDKEEQEFAASLMMKASALLDDRMRYNHWIAIHEETLRALGRTSSRDKVEAQEILKRLEFTLGEVVKGVKTENNINDIRTYSQICDEMWKTLDDEKQVYCAALMKKAMAVLGDAANYNYWVGVHDALSSRAN